MTSGRDFKRVYDRRTGRYRYQRYDGGAFFDNFRQQRPANLHSGHTGTTIRNAMQPLHSKNILPTVAKTIEEEATDVGQAILERLRVRSGKGTSELTINDRIKNLIKKGSGLQITN